MKKIWKLLTPDENRLKALKSTGFPEVLLKILLNRGIDNEQSIERYFSPRTRYLFSPFVMKGINKALDRILRAVETEESIRVYGDRDVDGVTSTVVLLETLKTFTKHVDYTVPVIEDGYGLNPDYIDAAVKDGVGLIVTVDCGIGNINEVKYAQSKGIDVVITDHHEPPNELPNAVSIVDPKLKGSMCPQKNIAGVGVAFKLSIALELSRSTCLKKPIIAFDISENDLDLIKFTPRGGFVKLKSLDKSVFSSCIPLFYSKEEEQAIADVLPDIAQFGRQNDPPEPIYVNSLVNEIMKEEALLSKKELIARLNLNEFCGARALLLLYLKCAEGKLASVRQLWQKYLDILAIGTIADMVPMHGENRSFAQMGLRFVGKSKRLGLNCLFTSLGWKNRSVSERDISFGIAPILNASGRLKTAELAIELLSTNLSSRANELAKQLFELNVERKRLGEECYKAAKAFLIEQNDIENDKILLVVSHFKNQGVTGIVATRLMLDYCRPVIVMFEDQGKFLGSARTFKNINIISALSYCAKYLDKFGGHISAAGLTMPFGNETSFRAALREYAEKNIDDDALTPEWAIDAKIDISEVNERFLGDLMKFAPFGIENPTPVFMAEEARFQEIRKVGETKAHLRFKFKKPGEKAVYGIGFNLAEIMVPEQIRDGKCDLVFHVEPNDYNGVRSAQLMVLDCRIRGFK